MIAGLPVASFVCSAVDSLIALHTQIADGVIVPAGTTLAVVSGPMRSILAAERTALNFSSI